MNNLEQKITDLEIKFSHQDELLSELNLIVAKQSIQIDGMMEALKAISTEASQGELSKDEKPPHY